jgi:inner membrane protein
VDPVTQGALGAALPQSLSSPAKLRWAALVGALSGMAPDLDVLIRSANDPLLFLEYHRQFTHALLFIPVGALICAIAFFPIVKRTLSFRQTYLFCLLGYATHGLLDACTTYGTQLFWPISDVRIAWNSVSVIDPLATLPLLALVLTAVVRKKVIFARAGIIWLLFYLALGVIQRDRAETAGTALAAERGHTPIRLEAKPSFGNILVWKTIYETDGLFHVDAIRAGLDITYFSGQAIEKFDSSMLSPKDSRQAEDIQRFSWFSNGYLAIDPDQAARIIDVRYSMVPNEIDALWGIELNAETPGEHVRFVTMRENSSAKLRKLAKMIYP